MSQTISRMSGTALGALLLCAALGSGAAAQAEAPVAAPSGPDRSGFTLELGLGLGITHVTVDGIDSETDIGLAPLSLSLGGFLSPDLALMFRMAGTSWFEDVLGTTVQLGNYFYGAALQYWVNDALFVAGGVGFGLLDDNPLFSSEVDVQGEGGIAFTARFGYSFVTLRDHSFAIVAELFPAFYGDVNAVGTAFNLQWQLL